jgi:hypothetical protein
MVATALRSVARSSTSQNVSASGASSPPKTAPRLAAGPAERDLGYQSPEGDLKDIFARGSYSGEDN